MRRFITTVATRALARPAYHGFVREDSGRLISVVGSFPDCRLPKACLTSPVTGTRRRWLGAEAVRPRRIRVIRYPLWRYRAGPHLRHERAGTPGSPAVPACTGTGPAYVRGPAHGPAA